MAQPVEEESIWKQLVPHLNELRQRLGVVLLVLVLGVIASFFFAEQVIRFIAVPIGGLDRLQSIQITENIGVYMRVALLIGFIPAIPVLVGELLAFIRPGLLDHERRWLDRSLLLVIPFALLLFLGGAGFAYFVMLPAALPFLTTFLGVQTNPRLSDYMNFVTNLIFWIGISFETPLVVFVMAKLRLVSAGMLARGWRVAVVVIAVMAAVVTPTVDPVNMGLLMLPLMALYGLSILLAKIARPGE